MPFYPFDYCFFFWNRVTWHIRYIVPSAAKYCFFQITVIICPTSRLKIISGKVVYADAIFIIMNRLTKSRVVRVHFSFFCRCTMPAGRLLILLLLVAVSKTDKPAVGKAMPNVIL